MISICDVIILTELPKCCYLISSVIDKNSRQSQNVQLKICDHKNSGYHSSPCPVQVSTAKKKERNKYARNFFRTFYWSGTRALDILRPNKEIIRFFFSFCLLTVQIDCEFNVNSIKQLFVIKFLIWHVHCTGPIYVHLVTVGIVQYIDFIFCSQFATAHR